MKKITGIILFLCLFLQSRADEGMWMLNNLDAQTVKLMRELGLQLNQQQLYNPDGTSLKDAVVSFGGYCTGVVVSADGLVFTNHHCGFSCIQQHSTPEHDYLKDGFIARTREEELPNPDLFVSFLIRTEKVTDRVLGNLSEGMETHQREMVIDSICTAIQDEAVKGDSTLSAIVSPYFAGNEYYLSIYRDYKDVRLVFAPPSSVGKFGGDTDNWMWPRQTGDFSVFRIYAGADNQPAEYAPENQPYHPTKFAPISLKGYKEGSFSMTIGFPGSTDRYLSSFGITERMNGWNAAMIQVRGVKQKIWREAMDANAAIRIMYDAKFAQSSNYWKNSIGMNESIEKLGVIAKKQALEKRLMEWIRQNPEKRQKYVHVLSNLENAYGQRADIIRTFYFLVESFFNSSDVLEIALRCIQTDFSADNPDAGKQFEDILKEYDDISLDLDKKVLVAMFDNYRQQMKGEPSTLPETYAHIDSLYKGSFQAYADDLYAKSKLVSKDSLIAMISRGNQKEITADPMISLAIDMVVKIQELRQSVYEATTTVEENERLLNAAIREMDQSQAYYSDANSTMRMSFGTVGSYTMANGENSGYYCAPDGLLEKVKKQAENKDFEMQPELVKMFESGDFGKYRDKKSKQLQLCFITNNDITGGNSGSPVFNGKGELIGLAFDGNWEAMSGDIVFEPNLQRCICVDIRFVLYMMEKWGCADSLIKELCYKK